ncbi:hypothetical protein KL86CLO1_10674 [uncultured Eubacteriales bacterium]|uniref:Uncharacterized protein n=1 Tax=uncultured Eubacteriales bacterium TaxID=172733 RepID=A0A212J878_9FIRM|nr:hypothetical protein KL86CLO1_10674 [uncultured Eubacteriales bacterium]
MPRASASSLSTTWSPPARPSPSAPARCAPPVQRKWSARPWPRRNTSDSGLGTYRAKRFAFDMTVKSPESISGDLSKSWCSAKARFCGAYLGNN